MLGSTTKRVPQSTSPAANAKIAAAIERSVLECASEGRSGIDRRLAALDAEWDIERTLEANAATAGLIGLSLGALVHRRFYALTALVAGFLLQHALQGWCPPVPVLRRLGVRTEREIDEERYALKALRGDFRNVESPAAAVAASRS